MQKLGVRRVYQHTQMHTPHEQPIQDLTQALQQRHPHPRLSPSYVIRCPRVPRTRSPHWGNQTICWHHQARSPYQRSQLSWWEPATAVPQSSTHIAQCSSESPPHCHVSLFWALPFSEDQVACL